MDVFEYSSNRSKEITDLFYESVYAIDSSIYNDEQKAAWAPEPIDYGKWEERLSNKRPYMVFIKGEIAGFIELESNGHIDCAYVSPKYQRMGVATNLLNHVMYIAKNLGLKQLYVEASIVAKPFFEKRGFIVEKKNIVIRQNVELVNYAMRLNI
jgi:putative acetyltransferase